MQPKQHNPNERARTKRLPRMHRTDFGHIEDGEANIWAVSYADLLMVLMSFFIIFFSFSDEKVSGSDLTLLNIAMSFRDGLGATTGKSAGAGAGQHSTATAGTGDASSQDAGSNPTHLLSAAAVEAMGAKIEIAGKYLYIRLPDDIFAKRKFALNQETEDKLRKLYATLAPKQDKLELIVIGHSDSLVVAGSTNPYLSNNFDLSALRALRALQFLISLGFPQSNISAQGSADGVRNSRSISLRIQLKESHS